MPDNILSQRESRRYRKQIMIPEIGTEGQEKLKKASVLVVGAGGLGCPVLQYLVAAGVGRIGLAEFDMVSEENLQRQILYGSNDVGKLKSIIARDRLEHLNSLVSLQVFNLKIDASNILSVIRDFNVIVDATDNLETRYIISDSCVILDKPMVHGAIYKFEGQVSVFNHLGGPTYRCYNPQNRKENTRNPAPSDVGILGVLPGITGTYMANETIKIITGIGKVLSGKVLLFNIKENSFYIISVRNVPENHKIKEVGKINKV
ncbi:MAG: HesA/MoeB/ThiF family protein [Bacteroidales bacterium]|jgi:adenylyltransferase/sulfurtransferase|nr:HesA/MoeB/ThiF family protein [Bacteroidales bacterium]